MKKNKGEGEGSTPLKLATRLARAGRRGEWTGIPGQAGTIVNPPVWRASTMLYEDVAHLRAAEAAPKADELYYGRRGAPTSWGLAEAITQMEPEAAAGTMLFPSGVAAVVTALLTVLRPGDELLMVDSAYAPTRAFCHGFLRQIGVRTIYYDPLIGGGIADLCTEKTRAIFLESPGSLTFEVQDVPAIVAVAKARGIVTLIDNTWATPLLLPALGMGVDISILACTKYIGGHSDLMLGSVTAAEAWWPALHKQTLAFGQMTSPDDAWLGARGMRSLDVRLRHLGDSALRIAQWLDAQPQVARVLHPALPSCPGHDLWARDFSGASGLFAIELAEGSDAARVALLDALELFGIGYSWGGYESLALPVDPVGLRSAVLWRERGLLVRLSIGLEDPDDLIEDLTKGLAQWSAKTNDP